MKREELKNELLEAANAGSLLTPKHDPTSVGTQYSEFRSVTVESSPGIIKFLEGDQYVIREYENTGGKHPPPFYEIVPKDPAVVPGSGIPAYSTIPTTRCDRFVAVSGTTQSWHLFAEQSTKIQERTDLQFLGVI